MSKDTQIQEENNKDEVVVTVNNTEAKPEKPTNLSEIENKKEDIKEADKMKVDGSLIDENTSFQTKSQQEGKKFSGTLSYEDVLSQTQELVDIKNTNIDYVAEEARLRKEKIEGLSEHFNDLNAKPLSSVDSYANYNLVLNKSIWNYNEESKETQS